MIFSSMPVLVYLESLPGDSIVSKLNHSLLSHHTATNSKITGGEGGWGERERERENITTK